MTKEIELIVNKIKQRIYIENSDLTQTNYSACTYIINMHSKSFKRYLYLGVNIHQNECINLEKVLQEL